VLETIEFFQGGPSEGIAMSEKKHEMEPLRKKELENAAEGTHEGLYYEPPVDIFETEDALHLVADMPGVSSTGVDIDLREGILTLLGRQPPAEEGSVTYREFRPGNYYRRFSLSEAIDQEKIEARMSNGVLSLRLPKVAKAKPRKIEISLG